MFFEQLFPCVIGGLVTLILALIIVLTQSWHGIWTNDSNVGVQKFHTQPTPRIGGLAILIGLTTSVLIGGNDLKIFGIPLLMAGLIPFCFGFSEDLTKQVSVISRLGSSVVGAVLAIWLTGIYLNRLDVYGIDFLILWWPIGVLLTVIAVSGVTNAINILDGFNGLASGTVLVIHINFIFMAFQVGDLQVSSLCLVIAGVTIGFMLLNYPFGKLFLGDAGAYFLGFLTAWIAILLPMRNEEISPWSTLLVCGYPVIEVLYSMMRRVRQKLNAASPDNLHLHTLIKTKIIYPNFKNISPRAKNSLVAPFIWVNSILIGLLANFFINSVLVLVIFFVILVLWYHLTYSYLIRLCSKE